ncbi:hypothetical protein TNCV_2086161 [Trichonephila clavipes]|nr:hypothetical protein TNCV_2086161 [Trichonephila clavipes]
MSPVRCNIGLTTPRHAGIKLSSLILGSIATHQAMPLPRIPVDRWEGVDGLQFVGQAYPTHMIYWIQVWISMLPNPYVISSD